MDFELAVLIGAIVGVVTIGMYMDWFDLWVSKDELRGKIDAVARQKRELAEQQRDADAGRC